MSRHSHPGRHELGQNFLVDRAVIGRVVDLVAATSGPVTEWGTGNGALTVPLAALGRPVEGVELDARRAARLQRRLGPHVCISEGDILRHAPPSGATVVSNVPFHLTTPVLRHLLAEPAWTDAVLLVQWEVARKRAGVGGATQLTAQWWPWFDFRLDGRVPATAFRPRPSVDGGLLVVVRRAKPLVATTDQQAYQDVVRRTFGGRGHGLVDVLSRSAGVPRRATAAWVRHQGLRPSALPRDLDALQWVSEFDLSRRYRRR